MSLSSINPLTSGSMSYAFQVPSQVSTNTSLLYLVGVAAELVIGTIIILNNYY